MNQPWSQSPVFAVSQPLVRSFTFKTGMMCLQIGRKIIWTRLLLKQISHRKNAMQSSGTDFVQLWCHIRRTPKMADIRPDAASAAHAPVVCWRHQDDLFRRARDVKRLTKAVLICSWQQKAYYGVDCSIDCSVYCSVDCSVYCSAYCSVDWSVDCNVLCTLDSVDCSVKCKLLRIRCLVQRFCALNAV